jgi:hypothetical protein
MDVLAFLIMVLLLVGIGRLVVAALAIQKNTREVADYFRWLRERQETQSQAAKQRAATSRPGQLSSTDS